MPKGTFVPIITPGIQPCSVNQHEITSSSSRLAAAGARPGVTVKSNLTDSVGGEAPGVSHFAVLLPMQTVSSACTLISPIWTYIIAAWSPDGWTDAND